MEQSPESGPAGVLTRRTRCRRCPRPAARGSAGGSKGSAARSLCAALRTEGPGGFGVKPALYLRLHRVVMATGIPATTAGSSDASPPSSAEPNFASRSSLLLTPGLQGRGNVQLISAQRARSFGSGKQMRTALMPACACRHRSPAPAAEGLRPSQLVGPTGTGSPQPGKPSGVSPGSVTGLLCVPGSVPWAGNDPPPAAQQDRPSQTPAASGGCFPKLGFLCLTGESLHFIHTSIYVLIWSSSPPWPNLKGYQDIVCFFFLQLSCRNS